MAIITTCPSCRKDIGIAEKSVGKRVICPLCKHEFTAAAPGPAPAAPTAVQPAAAPKSAAAAPLPAPAPPHPSETPLLRPVPPKPAEVPASPPTAAFKPGGRSGPAGSVQPKPLPPSKPIAAKPAAAQSGGGERRHRHRRGTSSKVAVLFFIGLALVVVAGGSAYLVPKMISASLTGKPRDIFNTMKVALDTNNPKLLESVVPAEDLQISEGDRAELLSFLSRHMPGAEKSMANAHPLAIALTCLKSKEIRANTWKYISTEQDFKLKEGVIVCTDDAETFVEFPIMQKDLSWRLMVVEYCLKVARAYNKAEAKKPAPPPGAPNAPSTAPGAPNAPSTAPGAPNAPSTPAPEKQPPPAPAPAAGDQKPAEQNTDAAK